MELLFACLGEYETGTSSLRKGDGMSITVTMSRARVRLLQGAQVPHEKHTASFGRTKVGFEFEGSEDGGSSPTRRGFQGWTRLRSQSGLVLI